jgi:hypothetical protein
MPFRAALGTGKTKRSLSTSASPVFFPTAAPGNLWMFLTALSPVREAYEAVKYSCVASVQRRAEMIAGELHIHKICAYPKWSGCFVPFVVTRFLFPVSLGFPFRDALYNAGAGPFERGTCLQPLESN